MVILEPNVVAQIILSASDNSLCVGLVVYIFGSKIDNCFYNHKVEIVHMMRNGNCCLPR